MLNCPPQQDWCQLTDLDGGRLLVVADREFLESRRERRWRVPGAVHAAVFVGGDAGEYLSVGGRVELRALHAPGGPEVGHSTAEREEHDQVALVDVGHGWVTTKTVRWASCSWAGGPACASLAGRDRGSRPEVGSSREQQLRSGEQFDRHWGAFALAAGQSVDALVAMRGQAERGEDPRRCEPPPRPMSCRGRSEVAPPAPARAAPVRVEVQQISCGTRPIVRRIAAGSS